MKPYNSEIIKAMAEHSDECAAYATAMAWDCKRRMTVKEADTEGRRIKCPFCSRYLDRGNKEDCPLNKIFGGCCHLSDSKDNLWKKVDCAISCKDQQAFTENANALYEQIRSIIDDFYKPEPKKDVFYKRGQRFVGPCGNYILAYVGNDKDDRVAMINLADGCRGTDTEIKVESVNKITPAEFKRICRYRTYTLIEESKK